jgi:hypothetical protein
MKLIGSWRDNSLFEEIIIYFIWIKGEGVNNIL